MGNLQSVGEISRYLRRYRKSGIFSYIYILNFTLIETMAICSLLSTYAGFKFVRLCWEMTAKELLWDLDKDAGLSSQRAF